MPAPLHWTASTRFAGEPSTTLRPTETVLADADEVLLMMRQPAARRLSADVRSSDDVTAIAFGRPGPLAVPRTLGTNVAHQPGHP